MNVRFLLSLALLSATPLALAQTAANGTTPSTTSSFARKSGAVVHQDFGKVKADRHDTVRTAAPPTTSAPTKPAAQSDIKPRDHASGMPTGRRMAKPDSSPTDTTPQDAARVKSHSNSSNNRSAATPTVATPQDAAKIKSHSNQTNN